MSAPPVAPLLLASVSPQRRAILGQLGLPFDVVAPDYDELPGTSPLERAAGKARSVDGGKRPVLAVDTEVLFGGELLDLIEVQAPPSAETHEYYTHVSAEWAKRWPAEEIWVAQKT